MKIRDHHQTADIIDGEESDVLEFLDARKDKSSEEYTNAVNNLKTLQEVKKQEIEMITERESLASEFWRGVAGGAASMAGLYLIWHTEKTGDVMLNSSEKSFVKDAMKIRFRPGH